MSHSAPLESWSRSADLSGRYFIDRSASLGISAADAEIDRLVYDLYGLTAEEMALVEGQE